MGHTVGSLAALVQGEVRGDADRPIGNAAAIESAGPDAVPTKASPFSWLATMRWTSGTPIIRVNS